MKLGNKLEGMEMRAISVTNEGDTPKNIKLANGTTASLGAGSTLGSVELDDNQDMDQLNVRQDLSEVSRRHSTRQRLLD